MFFDWTLFVVVLVAGQTLVISQACAAYLDEFFSPGQIGPHKGLPFVAHGGMWADFMLLTPILSAIVGVYGSHWKRDWCGAALVIGLIVSTAMHLFYARTSLPEAHARLGRLTVAGWLHAIYMTGAVAILALFYLRSKPAVEPLWVVSSALAVHVIVGNHFPLRWWAQRAMPRWYPRYPVLKLDATATVFVSMVAVLLLSLRAMGKFF